MRRRGAGWTVLLVLALALRTGPVARAVEEEEPLDLDTIVEIAEEDRGAAVATLVAADGLPEHAARALIEAVLARERMDDERVEPSAARLRAWEGALLDVLAAAPESGILAEALAPLSWSYEDAEAEASAARLAARVAGLPDPARTALLLNRELAGGAHAYEASGLPEGLYLERLEREGSRVLAVAFDWRFGLWAVRSRDGGTTWDAPLATGLRPRDPYGVTGRSGLPMTGDGRLRLEVVLWPRFDPAVVPVDPEAATEPLARGLLLELPWADLERDRDGDGLTDLAEAWLLTDPGNPDGDGDGRADAVDPLPQVAHRPGCDARARALVAVLRDIDAMWFPNAGVGAPAGCSAGSGADLPAPHSAEVLVARRSWFAPLEPAARLVVLEEAELEAAGSRLGHLPPIRLRLFVFDRTGDRALAMWDDCGVGSILLLRRRGGGWEETTAFRFGGCVLMVEEPVEETEEP